MFNGFIDIWLIFMWVIVMVVCQIYCFFGKIFIVFFFWNWYKFFLIINFSQIKVYFQFFEVYGYIQSGLIGDMDFDLL